VALESDTPDRESRQLASLSVNPLAGSLVGTARKINRAKFRYWQPWSLLGSNGCSG